MTCCYVYLSRKEFVGRHRGRLRLRRGGECIDRGSTGSDNSNSLSAALREVSLFDLHPCSRSPIERYGTCALEVFNSFNARKLRMVHGSSSHGNELCVYFVALIGLMIHRLRSSFQLRSSTFVEKRALSYRPKVVAMR